MNKPEEDFDDKDKYEYEHCYDECGEIATITTATTGRDDNDNDECYNDDNVDDAG